MTAVIFWKGGRMIECEEFPTLDEVSRMGCLGAPCVWVDLDTPARYGTFDVRKIVWKPMEYKDLPPGFKAALLIMEIR